MDPGDDISAACYRLRGEHDGEVYSFVVAAGRHRVGSDPTADIVLPVRGVSRRHARLDVLGDGVEVRDDGSKNGTRVNGEAVDEGLALVGDEIRFGPVVLRLEPASPDDARLGLWLEPPSSVAGGEPVADTTWLSRTGSSTGELGWHLLDAVLDRLDGLPEADLDGVVQRLAGHFGALGAAFVEWPATGGAVALAAAGAIGPVPSLDAPAPAARSARRAWWPIERDGDPAVDGVAVERQGGALGLLLWRSARSRGGDASRRGDAEWLALVLRLLACFRPRPLADATPAEPPGDDEALRFPPGIVRGESPAMVALYQQLRLLLRGAAPVLIVGETGVGKEHLARLLHDSSERRDGPFVAVNCAAIPSELLEAEMFGIAKGVATGVQSRRGRFAEASGGTLFLDEIGDMPASLQAKLLRALQEKTIHPLGRAPEAVDVRVVSATNTRLQDHIADGSFRQDLYYRLAGYTLRVPPLRERFDDLPLLVGHFLRRTSREVGKVIRGVSLAALQRMAEHPWPGNVRELEHEVRRLVYVCPAHQAIDSEMLSPEIGGATEGDSPVARDESVSTSTSAAVARPVADVPSLGSESLADQLAALERRLLIEALRRTAGNQSRAARLLQVSRNGLAQRLRRHDLDAAAFRS